MYLGIEIGGTKLQLGLGQGDGILTGLWRGDVDVAQGPEGIRRQILAAVPELLTRSGVDRGEVRAVGIGFGGPVDDATHRVIKSHQIQGWDDFPLADWITDLLGWPAVLGNDADCGGLAEALFGAGQGRSPIFYITVGSGIGGGLIIDGQIYRGAGRGAAEIGHLPVAEPTKTGIEFRPLEEAASGWAIARKAQEWIEQRHPDGLRGADALVRLAGGGKDRISAKHVGQAAAQGNALAALVLNRATDCLAGAIAQVIALLCPRRFVIGGGVALLGEEIFFQPLRQKVAGLVFAPFAGCYDIVSATLGEEMVVHGALVLARRKLEKPCP
jgi:glucokinase